MKNVLLALLPLLLSLSSFGQNHIVNMELIPPNPTSADHVKVVVELSFSSTSCHEEVLQLSTLGNTFLSSSHHCLGLLGAICQDFDTFDLGVLAIGSYQFINVQTSGLNINPCTPGIVPDDTDTLDFMVIGTVGMEALDHAPKWQLAPNPSSSQTAISLPSQAHVSVYSINGKLQWQQTLTEGQHQLPPVRTGLYLVNVRFENGYVSTQRWQVLNRD